MSHTPNFSKTALQQKKKNQMILTEQRRSNPLLSCYISDESYINAFFFIKNIINVQNLYTNI